jgi:hypothetical protein
MMIGKVLAAAIGAKIDQSDGEGGFKGAALGILGAALVRRIFPAAVLVGGAWAAKRAWDRRSGGTAAV